MKIEVEVKAPELVKAIRDLAVALTVSSVSVKNYLEEANAEKEDVEAGADVETIAEAEAVVEPEKEDVVEITLEDIRAAFMGKNSKINTPKLKKILSDHKVKKVTDLEEKDFESVLKALEAI